MPCRLVTFDQSHADVVEDATQFCSSFPRLAFQLRAHKDWKPWINACTDLGEQLLQEADAKFMWQPPICTDTAYYHSRVKHSLGLMDVYSKLHHDDKAQVYASPEAFASDLRLVFRNVFVCQIQIQNVLCLSVCVSSFS
jgi:hypothetical protein